MIKLNVLFEHISCPWDASPSHCAIRDLLESIRLHGCFSHLIPLKIAWNDAKTSFSTWCVRIFIHIIQYQNMRKRGNWQRPAQIDSWHPNSILCRTIGFLTHTHTHTLFKFYVCCPYWMAQTCFWSQTSVLCWFFQEKAENISLQETLWLIIVFDNCDPLHVHVSLDWLYPFTVFINCDIFMIIFYGDVSYISCVLTFVQFTEL